jgi:hypothetical protein
VLVAKDILASSVQSRRCVDLNMSDPISLKKSEKMVVSNNYVSIPIKADVFFSRKIRKIFEVFAQIF